MTLDHIVRKSRNLIGSATLSASLLASSGCSLISHFDEFAFDVVPDGSIDGYVPDSSMPDAYQPDTHYDSGVRDSGRDTGYDARIRDARPEASVDAGMPDMGYDAGDANYDAHMPDSMVAPDSDVDAGVETDAMPDANYDAGDAFEDAGMDSDAFIDTDGGIDAMIDLDTGMEDAGNTDTGMDTDSGSDAGLMESYTQPYMPDTHCVALYHFDNPLSLEDSCRTNDLTAMGTTVSMGRTPEFREARHLGVDDSMSAPDSDDLTLSGNGFTVEAWVRMDAYADGVTNPRSYIAGRNNGTTGGSQWYLAVEPDGHLVGSRYLADCANNDSEMITSGNVIPLDTWTHIAFIYDTPANVEHLYINGMLEREYTPARSGLCANPTVPLTIGTDGTGQQHFNGDIDELRILDEARQP